MLTNSKYHRKCQKSPKIANVAPNAIMENVKSHRKCQNHENDKNHWIMLEICKKAKKKTEKCEMSAKKRKMQQKYMLKITENGQISTKG